MFCVIHMRAILQQGLKLISCIMSLKLVCHIFQGLVNKCVGLLFCKLGQYHSHYSITITILPIQNRFGPCLWQGRIWIPFTISVWINGIRCKYISMFVFFNTLRPRQNGRHFSDDIFKRTFLNENDRILIQISLKFVPRSPIDNNPALVRIMAWHLNQWWLSLMTHKCVIQPQCVNKFSIKGEVHVLV